MNIDYKGKTYRLIDEDVRNNLPYILYRTSRNNPDEIKPLKKSEIHPIAHLRGIRVIKRMPRDIMQQINQHCMYRVLGMGIVSDTQEKVILLEEIEYFKSPLEIIALPVEEFDSRNEDNERNYYVIPREVPDGYRNKKKYKELQDVSFHLSGKSIYSEM